MTDIDTYTKISALIVNLVEIKNDLEQKRKECSTYGDDYDKYNDFIEKVSFTIEEFSKIQAILIRE